MLRANQQFILFYWQKRIGWRNGRAVCVQATGNVVQSAVEFECKSWHHRMTIFVGGWHSGCVVWMHACADIDSDEQFNKKNELADSEKKSRSLMPSSIYINMRCQIDISFFLSRKRCWHNWFFCTWSFNLLRTNEGGSEWLEIHEVCLNWILPFCISSEAIDLFAKINCSENKYIYPSTCSKWI